MHKTTDTIFCPWVWFGVLVLDMEVFIYWLVKNFSYWEGGYQSLHSVPNGSYHKKVHEKLCHEMVSICWQPLVPLEKCECIWLVRTGFNNYFTRKWLKNCGLRFCSIAALMSVMTLIEGLSFNSIDRIIFSSLKRKIHFLNTKKLFHKLVNFKAKRLRGKKYSG